MHLHNYKFLLSVTILSNHIPHTISNPQDGDLGMTAVLSSDPDSNDETVHQQQQHFSPTTKFCATTKVSFQNYNFDYTWRIIGLIRHMIYLKKFRNEFQIKYENFKILRGKFSGEWTISLTRDNLTLEYITFNEDEARTNFVCILELVVEKQSKVYEFKRGEYHEEQINSQTVRRQYQEVGGEDEGDEDDDDGNGSDNGKNANVTTGRNTNIVKKSSTISWPDFGENLLEFVDLPNNNIDTVEIIFHIQAFRASKHYTVPTCFSE